MAIVIRDTNSSATDTSSGSLSVSRPTVVAGDLLVVIAARSQSSGSNGFNGPSGWSRDYQVTGNTTYGPMAVFTKTATGSEPSSYTFTNTYSSADQFILHIMSLEGADTSNPIAAGGSVNNHGSTTSTITAPSLVIPSGLPDDALLLCSYLAFWYDATPNSYGYRASTAGMTEIEDLGDVWAYLGTYGGYFGNGTTGSKSVVFEQRSNGASRTANNPPRGISIAIRPAVSAFAPTVNAGANVAMNQFETLNRVATEDDGGATITSRSWTVQSGPAYVGSTLSTSATLAWKPETPGNYTLRYTATNEIGSDSDDISVTVDTVYDFRIANLPLQASYVGGPNFPGGSREASLSLTGNSVGEKQHDEPITAPLTLSMSHIGQRINVATAHIKLQGFLSAWSRPGQGSATARIKLLATRTGQGDRTAGATAPLALTALSPGAKNVSDAPSPVVVLSATRAGFKDVSGTFLAPFLLAATRTDYTRHTDVARTALVRLGTNTNPRFTTRGAPQIAMLHLHAVPVATSERFNQSYTAPFTLRATIYGYRVEAALTDAVRAKADLGTKYELVCVARIPQSSGPPILLEVDPVDWTGLTITEELNKPSSLSVQAKFTKITNEVLNRLRSPDELATELWLNRNGKRIFSGPLLGVNASGEALTLEAQDILAYTDMWIIEEDLSYKDTEQFEIVADLIDRWQATSFGNFGLITSDIPPSGILRAQTYLKKEMTHIFKAIDDMGKMTDGFDFGVDPVSRRLELYYPYRGQDRSIGEDAIVFDSRNVSSDTVTFSVGPRDLASDSFGSAGQTDDAVLYSHWFNDELRTRYGRTAYGSTYQSAKEQATLDSYTQAAGLARSQTLYIPGPNTRVTPDADINNYEIGDYVSYTMHNQLNALGSFRIRKRVIDVDGTGKENVSVEFV